MLKKKRINTSKVKKSKSFLLSLFDMLNDTNYKEIIYWSSKGDSIIIEDVDKFSNIVLPNFFIHNKYSSFVRQLNVYGFHKNREFLNKEIFISEKFNKNSTKEEIKNIERRKKGMKLSLEYDKSKDQDKYATNNNTIISNNGNDLIKFLLFKNNEDKERLINLKKECENLKNINKSLKEQFLLIKNAFYGNSIIIKKIILYKSKSINIIKAKNKNVKNIKELFRKYLYYLRIYSPYILIKNEDSKSINSIKF